MCFTAFVKEFSLFNSLGFPRIKSCHLIVLGSDGNLGEDCGQKPNKPMHFKLRGRVCHITHLTLTKLYNFLICDQTI